MLSRIGYYADRALELGWLAAVVLVPLFFNVYSSRVFEPDKISTLRSLVLLMTVAWLIKLFEGGLRAYREHPAAVGATSRSERLAAAARGAAESGTPSWLGVFRVPMVVPILVYALAYLVSSLFTISPDATLWGSYQRLQGTYSQYSYMMLGLIVLANLRTRAQIERLVSFMLLTSMIVAVYGLLQSMRLDPLPWAGDTATRVASTMGNAIFVAAWLIMIVPFTLYRLFLGLSAGMSARRVAAEPVAAQVSVPERGRSRASRRLPVASDESYDWAVVANNAGIILIQIVAFLFALDIAAGLPLPDAGMWWVLPLMLLVFYAGCWAIEWLGNHRDDPRLASRFLIITGVVLAVVSLLTLPVTWSIDRTNAESPGVGISLEATGFLWVLFVMLMWGSICVGAYALAGGDDDKPAVGRDVVRTAANAGYALLLVIQLTCIYLTQSRGPWLGLGAGLVVLAIGMWLVGRSRQVTWMRKVGGTASAVVLAGAIFVLLLNIPGSPLKVLDGLPVIGRGIERLSTITRTEDGTGKVRTLIWEGATNLILAEPMRTLIGWGPEAMYVAYNPYYPPELAHFELRNATPDRSHNVEFDQLVTMGVMGLLAYYFLVGAFFFYGIRIARRATNIRDQLFALALLASMAAHFIEIQTGIQIAATWTYFYLLVGAMVAFGFYINGYLRQEHALATGALPANAEEVEVVSGVSSGVAQGAVLATSSSSAPGGRGAATAPVQASGNGKARAKTGQQSRSASQSAGSANGGRDGRDGRGVQDGSGRRQRDSRGFVTPQPARVYSNDNWINNPVMAVVYVLMGLAALVVVWTVNSATVRADTLYKQGQAYDAAQRWPESISFYQRALDIQPNQDYYHLFLGRSWLEFAKQVSQEDINIRNYYESGGVEEKYKPEGAQDAASEAAEREKRAAERLLRLQRSEEVLRKAQALNPLNTDHYANLGRLYMYWADPSGGGDPSKGQLAVDNMLKATTRSPGNAQLWDELGVAYSRNGQFDKAIETLKYSQREVDPIFARTPFIMAQLYQERALQVRDALRRGVPLPTGGETDYGTLVLGAGEAYSATVGLDTAQFMDTSYQNRIDFFITAAQPITGPAAQLDVEAVGDVLTNTLKAAFERLVPLREKDLANYVRTSIDASVQGDKVPDALLRQWWEDPNRAALKSGADGDVRKQWVDSGLSATATSVVLPYLGLAYIHEKTGEPDRARELLLRAQLINPEDDRVKQELERLGDGS